MSAASADRTYSSSRIRAASGHEATPSRARPSSATSTDRGSSDEYPRSSIGKNSASTAWHRACPEHLDLSRLSFTFETFHGQAGPFGAILIYLAY